jgi:SAM-dependent methyltransferase
MDISESAREGHYMFAEAPDDLERERITCLERMLDPVTTSRLERIGVGPGWACLEVAAGGGSIAAWLGDRVGPGGSVLATDVNTRFLGHLQPPIKVQTMNLLTDDIKPDTFDLVHGRGILTWLAQAETVLAKMAAGVKPGGFLFIEEPDYDGFGAVEPINADTRAWTDRHEAAHRRITDAGIMDAFFGRRVRGLLEGVGFESVVTEGVTHIWRGGELGARFQELGSTVARAAGTVTFEDHAQTVRLMNDSGFLFKGATVYGAWGTRPS